MTIGYVDPDDNNPHTHYVGLDRFFWVSRGQDIYPKP